MAHCGDTPVVVTINTEEEGQIIYFVPFKMYREKKLMRIHITRAYPEEVMPKLDKIFSTLQRILGSESHFPNPRNNKTRLKAGSIEH